MEFFFVKYGVELQTDEDELGCTDATGSLDVGNAAPSTSRREGMERSLTLNRGSLNRSPRCSCRTLPLQSVSISTLRRPTPRCCLGWSRSAVRAGYPTCSFSFCGWHAPVSVWSWPPTSSAASSRPPPPPEPPPLPPPSLCHLDSSVWRRKEPKTACLTDARDVRCCSHHSQNQVCSTDHLQAGSEVAL